MKTSEKLISYLKSKGINYKVSDNGINFEDPFKKPDKRLTLYYYFDTGLCKGYRSQFKGSLLKVIAEIEGCTLAQAKLIIGEVKTTNFASPPKPEVNKSGKLLPPYCEPILNARETNTWRAVTKYLMDRGLEVDDVRRYQLHYCWAGPQDWRIIIPYFQDQKFIFWQARDVTGSGLRYTFPKKEEYGVGAGDVIYNIDQQNEDLILCEGPFDAMTIGGASLGGASLSKNQLNIILKKKFKRVVLAIDNDEAGFAMLDRVAQKLYSYIPEVYYCIPEGGKDWNEIGRDKAFEILDNPIRYKAPHKILERFNF